MNIKQMEYFIAIVEQGSFYNASQHLRIAQSALGAQIRNLEEEVGVALLLRHPRGVALTEAGGLFLVQAKFILDEVRRAKQTLIDSAGPPRGRLTIGMTPSLIHIFAGEIAARCIERFPDIRLTVRSSSVLAVAQMVGSGELDLGLIAGDHGASGLEAEDLGWEELYLVQAGTVGLEPTIALSQLVGMKLIVTPSPGGFTESLLEAARRQHLELDVRAEIDSVSVILDLVRAGTGATILPRSLWRAASDGTLAGRVIAEPRLRRSIQLIQSRQRAPSKAEGALRGLVTEVVRGRLEAGAEPQPYPTTI